MSDGGQEAKGAYFGQTDRTCWLRRLSALERDEGSLLGFHNESLSRRVDSSRSAFSTASPGRASSADPIPQDCFRHLSLLLLHFLHFFHTASQHSQRIASTTRPSLSTHTHTYTITATATATVPTTVHQEERPLIVAQMIPPNRNPILSHFPYSQHRHFRYAPAIFYSILSYSVLFTWHRWQLISQYLVS